MIFSFATLRDSFITKTFCVVRYERVTLLGVVRHEKGLLCGSCKVRELLGIQWVILLGVGFTQELLGIKQVHVLLDMKWVFIQVLLGI